MQVLDELVCRGTHIMDKGVRYVVVKVVHRRKWDRAYLRLVRLNEDDSISYGDFKMWYGQEVDLCFPGPVWELSPYL